jgi:hypothetical protein
LAGNLQAWWVVVQFAFAFLCEVLAAFAVNQSAETAKRTKEDAKLRKESPLKNRGR